MTGLQLGAGRAGKLLAIAPDGSTAIGAQNQIEEHDPNGALAWTAKLEPLDSADIVVLGLGFDDHGGSVVLWQHGLPDLKVQRFDDTGTASWSSQIVSGMGEDVASLSVQPDGSFFVVASYVAQATVIGSPPFTHLNDRGLLVASFDPSAKPVAARDAAGADGSQLVGLDVAITGEKGVFVTGRSRGSGFAFAGADWSAVLTTTVVEAGFLVRYAAPGL
jgi:hypothetical protein